MAASPLPHLELSCLGPPRARLDGHEPPPEVLWAPHLALLMYLSLSPDGTRTRDHLIGLLWPEKSEKDAKHSLNQALYRLRDVLGADRLVSRGETIRLDNTGLTTDAAEFTALTERDPARAIALIRGDFLEGFILDGAPEFEEWVGIERQRWRVRAASALVARGEQLLAGCRFAEASDIVRRVLAIESFSEPAIRLLMRAAALSGDAARALAAFHEFAQQLERGIGEKPSRELTALAERIRRQTSRPAGGAAITSVEATPLVGRATLHEAVFAELRLALAGGPRALAITGAPGMGRTRLLSECAKRLVLEGALIALARPLPSDHDAPYSTLRLLLRGGIATAPGLVGADPDTLGILAALVPELATRATPRPAQDAAQTAAALGNALAALAEETPVALLLDDAQLSDDASLDALRAALEQVRSAPLMIVLSIREEPGAAPRALLRLRGEIGRGLQGNSVRPDPFSPVETKQLVDTLGTWCKDDTDRERLARRLDFESAGNPFFLVTLLQGLQRLATMRADFLAWPPAQATYDSPLPFSIPSLVRVAIAARIAELDSESRRVLEAASVGGQAIDLDLTSRLAEIPKTRIEDRLAVAERLHLVQFDGQRYGFAAPLIAEVVRGECLTAGQKRALRQRAIELLAARDDLEARVLRAELRSAVDPGPSSLNEAIAVANAALATGSVRTARRAIAAAERAAGQDTGLRKGELETLRIELRGRTGSGEKAPLP